MNNKWATLDISEVEVGCWYSICCHCDLSKIENHGELSDVFEMMNGNEPPSVSVWETKIDALKDMVNGHSGQHPIHIAECKDLLEKEMRLERSG